MKIGKADTIGGSSMGDSSGMRNVTAGQEHSIDDELPQPTAAPKCNAGH